MTLESLYEALEDAFPPTIAQGPFGETKCQQFTARIEDGISIVFLVDPTPERSALLDEVLASLA
jgi:hypothetical protein